VKRKSERVLLVGVGTLRGKSTRAGVEVVVEGMAFLGEDSLERYTYPSGSVTSRGFDGEGNSTSPGWSFTPFLLPERENHIFAGFH